MQNINFTDSATWTVEDLMDSLRAKPIKKDKVVIPQYQRKLVWALKQKKEFIDSIKKGFPFGALLLFKNGSEGNITKYALVDGLQRTTTIKDYVENPTKFIEKDDIDDIVVNKIVEVLGLVNEDKEKIKSILVTWLKGLKGFKESDGYSSFKMSKLILDSLELENKSEYMEEINDILVPLKEKIEKESDILRAQIPVIIYSGDENNLPIIFERINSKGTKLSKYEIFAATWFNETLKISNTEIIEYIKDKYDALIEEGLEVNNYDPMRSDFYQTDFTVFEFMFGLGKYIAKKYPYLFGDNGDSDSIDSIAFNLYTICLLGDLKHMSKLPKALEKIDKERFLEIILDCIEIVFNALRPYITMKANKKSNRQDKNVVIYHTEYQIISFISKVFFAKYDKNLEEKVTWKNTKKDIIDNIPYHYLADIIKEFWRGSGDSKLKELIQDGSRYEKPIYKENWNNILKEWFNQQLDREEKCRITLRDTDILFLKYIYSHIMTTYQDLSSQEFEIDHIIPIDQLKNIAKVKGLPMSAVSNLCIIDKRLNRSKSSLTIYQYYDKQVKDGKITEDQANNEIKKAEKFTFTCREELNYDSITCEKYKDILEIRFNTLLNKFYTTNKIVRKNSKETDNI